MADSLYPPIEPHRREHLAVGGAHRIHVEESGNPHGIPVLFLHGGPGSQTRAVHRQFFDPAVFRIVLFDQRGCGQSTPFGSIADNTTAHLVADIEAIRLHLSVDAWVLFGGSWGSTLALAYATTHPSRVRGLILRGVFLGSRGEVDWFLGGVRQFLPEAWERFTRGAGEGNAIVACYRAWVDDSRADVAAEAATRWSDYEISCIEPAKSGTAVASTPSQQNVGRVAVQLHYMTHDFFLRPGQLLDNLWRIADCPAFVVQGRLDMVCPPLSAHEVSARLKRVQLEMVANGGHSATQPEMAAALVSATRRMAALLGA